MLGRFDATSVVDPAVSVITNVGLRPHRRPGGMEVATSPGRRPASSRRPPSCASARPTRSSRTCLRRGAARRQIFRRYADFDCVRQPTGRRRPPGERCDHRPVSTRTSSCRCTAPIRATTRPSLWRPPRPSSATPLPDDVLAEGFGSLAPARSVRGPPARAARGARRGPQPGWRRGSGRDPGGGTSTVGGRRILVTGMMGEKDAGWMLESLGADDAELVICHGGRHPPSDERLSRAGSRGGGGGLRRRGGTRTRRTRWRVHWRLRTTDDVVFGAGSLYVVGNLRDAWFALSGDAGVRPRGLTPDLNRPPAHRSRSAAPYTAGA